MSLAAVWIRTFADGLVRADQVIGIDAHRTPEISGKPTRWLLDVVLAAPAGGGLPDSWDVGVLHRTVIQTDQPPGEAPSELARLLAHLDRMNAAGLIIAVAASRPVDGAASVAFQFAPFLVDPRPPPVADDSEYL